MKADSNEVESFYFNEGEQFEGSSIAAVYQKRVLLGSPTMNLMYCS